MKIELYVNDKEFVQFLKGRKLTLETWNSPTSTFTTKITIDTIEYNFNTGSHGVGCFILSEKTKIL